jgi:chemotaxis protein MotB
MPKVKVEKDNSERWLLTYADLMNLLLILFILLYTMANVDVAKYQQVAASLRAAFGDSAAMQIIAEGGAAPSMVNLENTAPSPVVPAELEQQQAEALKEDITEIIKKEGLSGQVEVTMQERGVVVSIEEKVLFKSGSADIEADSIPTIEKIGRVLLAVPGKHIKIEGHTDNVPISSARFPDNQELSTARANSVWRILVKNVGLNPDIMSTVGYGEYRPRFPNTTAENRAQNRRVDIAILNEVYNKAESGAEQSTTSSEGLTTQMPPDAGQ